MPNQLKIYKSANLSSVFPNSIYLVPFGEALRFYATALDGTVKSLDADTVDGFHAAGFIQNQNVSAQSASAWINGNIKFSNGNDNVIVTHGYGTGGSYGLTIIPTHSGAYSNTFEFNANGNLYAPGAVLSGNLSVGGNFSVPLLDQRSTLGAMGSAFTSPGVAVRGITGFDSQSGTYQIKVSNYSGDFSTGYSSFAAFNNGKVALRSNVDLGNADIQLVGTSYFSNDIVDSAGKKSANTISRKLYDINEVEVASYYNGVIAKINRRIINDTDYSIVNSELLVVLTAITETRTVTIDAAVLSSNSIYHLKDESGNLSAEIMWNISNPSGLIDGNSEGQALDKPYEKMSYYTPDNINIFTL